jgi:hypothetical protein
MPQQNKWVYISFCVSFTCGCFGVVLVVVVFAKNISSLALRPTDSQWEQKKSVRISSRALFSLGPCLRFELWLVASVQLTTKEYVAAGSSHLAVLRPHACISGLVTVCSCVCSGSFASAHCLSALTHARKLCLFELVCVHVHVGMSALQTFKSVHVSIRTIWACNHQPPIYA